MSCTKCGCRMVTKVGRTSTMLICCDCGHPRAEKDRPHWISRQHLATAALLVALVGLAFAIPHITKETTTPAEPESTTQAE